MTHLPLDLIESHTGPLRRLALQLVRDPHEADDAVQETWLQALRAPPVGLDRLRGWLETVLRNVIRRRHRQRGRARDRELRAGGSGSPQPTVDVVVRRRTLRALTAAILELDTELQECVFLRYFDGIPPREIARGTGRPVSVVYRQLERAKRELKSKLGEDGRGWRGGLAALFGIRAPEAGLFIGGLIVSKKAFVIAGSVLAMVAALTGSLLWSPGEYVPTSAGDAQPMRAAAVADQRVEGSAPEDVLRSEVGEERSALNRIAPFQFGLEVWAKRTDDLPGANVPIWVGPAHHDLNKAQTGEDGVLRIQWWGRTPTATVYLASPRDLSKGKRLRKIVIHSGETATAAIRVAPLPQVTLSFAVDAKGATQLRPAKMTYRIQKDAYKESAVGWIAAAPRGSVPDLYVDPEGFAWFSTATVSGESAAQTLFHETTLRAVNFNAPVVVSGKTDRWQTVTSTFLPDVAVFNNAVVEKRERIIRGFVRDARGEPVQKAAVRSGDVEAKTNAEGEFVLKVSVADGETVPLRAGGGDLGLAFGELLVRGEDELLWGGVLDRGIEFEGQLVDEDGNGLAKWRVEIQPEDGAPWIDGTETDKAGFFSIPNVEHRTYSIRAFPPKSTLPVFQQGALRAALPHLISVPQIPSRGKLGLHVRTPDDKAVGSAQYRLWDEAMGEGILLDGGTKPRDLGVGIYAVEFGGTGQPWADLAPVQIFAGELTELRETLPGNSSVLDLADAVDFALYLLHDQVPSRVNIENRKKLALPPGTYHAIGPDLEVELEVVPGENLLPKALRR